MTNEEKRFKIEKIEKFKREIKGVQLNIGFTSFLAGLSAMSTIVFVSGAISYDDYNFLIGGILSGGGMLIPSLYGMMESIAKKTHLKFELDKLKDELEIEENQEKKRR